MLTQVLVNTTGEAIFKQGPREEAIETWRQSVAGAFKFTALPMLLLDLARRVQEADNPCTPS